MTNIVGYHNERELLGLKYKREYELTDEERNRLSSSLPSNQELADVISKMPYKPFGEREE